MSSSGFAPPPLAESELHCWLLAPETPAASALLERSQAWLSEEEKDRAARFHFERDRRLFLLGRGLARAHLGALLHLPPEGLRFQLQPKGKPELAEGQAPFPLFFNVSHTAGLVALALSGSLVGIDVECFARLGDPLEVGATVFSPEEMEQLRSVDGDARHQLFATFWTLKEAYIKARGGGFSLPLKKVTCVLTEPEAPRLRFAPDFDDAPEAWQLGLFRPSAQHFGAFALRLKQGLSYTTQLHVELGAPAP